MSTFGIFIETIATVRPHPNADRLELAELEGIGYQFVIGKGTFKPGDRVLYFPIDSVLPEALIAKLGLTGKLSGKAKNRVKTIRLRGEISQGIVGPTSLLVPEGAAAEDYLLAITDAAGEKFDHGPALGVTKYEPEERVSGGPNSPSVNQHPLPENVGKYDLENAERWKGVAEVLMDEPVVVTEKMEGSHIALTHYPDGRRLLCSRNCLLGDYTLEGDVAFGQHYFTGARNSRLHEVMDRLVALWPGEQITLRGELLGPGVQGNIYHLKTLQVRLFEVERNGLPIDAHDFVELDAIENHHVPVLWVGVLRDWLAGTDLRSMSDGYTRLSDPHERVTACRREGVVIKPFRERTHPRLGRLVLKQRSPAYLADEKDAA